MNSFLNILKPKKAKDTTVKAKKSNGFYLEAVDDESSPTDHAIDTSAESAAIVAAAPAQPEGAESAITLAEPTSVVTSSKPAVKSAKTKKFKGKAIAAAEESATDVIETTAVVEAPAPAPVQPSTTTFAPQFLSPTLSPTPRRRPGPSLAAFMDMAQQVGPRR